jgi:hypothetical protein
MEQLFFFSELQSIEYAELEGLIDPKVDADFLAEIGKVFDSLRGRELPVVEADAA